MAIWTMMTFQQNLYFGIALYHIVLHVLVWYYIMLCCIVLYCIWVCGIAWYYVILHCIIWYCIVCVECVAWHCIYYFYSIAWFCMILHCSHFMELHNIANHGIVLGGATLYHLSLHCIAWFAR